MPAAPTGITRPFAARTDRRADRGDEQQQRDILTIAWCAVLCGADEWSALAEFGTAMQGGVATGRALPNGNPSPDTCGRVELRRLRCRRVRPVLPRLGARAPHCAGRRRLALPLLEAEGRATVGSTAQGLKAGWDARPTHTPRCVVMRLP